MVQGFPTLNRITDTCENITFPRTTYVICNDTSHDGVHEIPSRGFLELRALRDRFCDHVVTVQIKPVRT